MTLSSCSVNASIAVSDMATAREFYEDKLGLSPEAEQADESQIYVCARNTKLHVYSSPDSAGKTAGTIATWHTTDLEQIVDALSAGGVTFEHYDDPPLQTDAKGIQILPDGKVAWFRDPDGNTFAIEQ